MLKWMQNADSKHNVYRIAYFSVSPFIFSLRKYSGLSLPPLPLLARRGGRVSGLLFRRLLLSGRSRLSGFSVSMVCSGLGDSSSMWLLESDLELVELEGVCLFFFFVVSLHSPIPWNGYMQNWYVYLHIYIFSISNMPHFIIKSDKPLQSHFLEAY